MPRLRSLMAAAALLVSAGVAVPASAHPVPTHPVPSHPLKTITVHASDGAKYVLKVWAIKHGQPCLSHAYGTSVRHFLQTHHCRGVSRYLVTTTVHGNAVGFAQSGLGFAEKTETKSYQAAGQFRSLVTKNGTGNFYSLFHDGYRLPSGPQHVPNPDSFTALAQDSGVTIVDAWYLHVKTPAHSKALARMANDIYLQWGA